GALPGPVPAAGPCLGAPGIADDVGRSGPGAARDRATTAAHGPALPTATASDRLGAIALRGTPDPAPGGRTAPVMTMTRRAKRLRTEYPMVHPHPPLPSPARRRFVQGLFLGGSALAAGSLRVPALAHERGLAHPGGVLSGSDFQLDIGTALVDFTG